MFTVIYDTRDGLVQGLTSGQYTEEEFKQAYDANFAMLETEELPTISKPYREYLAVEEGVVVVKEREITEEILAYEKDEELRNLKQYLSDTDYTVIKCMEQGLSMSDLYPEVLAKRVEARARINELEG